MGPESCMAVIIASATGLMLTHDTGLIMTLTRRSAGKRTRCVFKRRTQRANLAHCAFTHLFPPSPAPAAQKQEREKHHQHRAEHAADNRPDGRTTAARGAW